MTNDQGQSASLEELDKTMCKMVPRLSKEDRAALDLASHEKSWPWFKLRDEIVPLEQDSSRWFLGGREIESYECR